MKKIAVTLLLASGLAAGLNQAIWFFTTEVLAQEYVLAMGGEIPVIAPTMFSLLQGIVGGLIVAAIARRTKAPQKSWLIISLVALVLSFILPFGGVVGIGAAIWLNVMHVVAGAVIIPMVWKALAAK